MQKNQIGISNVLHDSLDQTRCYWSGIEKNWPYTICDCKKRSGIRRGIAMLCMSNLNTLESLEQLSSRKFKESNRIHSIRPFEDFAALPEAAPIKDGQVTINGSATPN